MPGYHPSPLCPLCPGAGISRQLPRQPWPGARQAPLLIRVSLVRAQHGSLERPRFAGLFGWLFHLGLAVGRVGAKMFTTSSRGLVWRPFGGRKSAPIAPVYYRRALRKEPAWEFRSRLTLSPSYATNGRKARPGWEELDGSILTVRITESAGEMHDLRYRFIWSAWLDGVLLGKGHAYHPDVALQRAQELVDPKTSTISWSTTEAAPSSGRRRYPPFTPEPEGDGSLAGEITPAR